MNKNLKKLREIIVKRSHESKEGHIPSAFSILEILWVLYDKILKYNPKNHNDPQRDYFVLSKGHASLGLYAVLLEKKLLNTDDIDNFCEFNSILGGHPDRNKINFVEASTGSLGHGMPIAVGIALGNKINSYKGRVYSIIGDGECNEGTIWESALIASHHKLDNLCVIIDNNHSTDRALNLGSLEDKFRSFGWNIISIDGHSEKEIYSSIKKISVDNGKPSAIIANTIKGHGIKSMENNPAWHHKSPSKEELDKLIQEIYEYN